MERMKRIGDNVRIIVKDTPFNGFDIHDEFDLFLAEKGVRILWKD